MHRTSDFGALRERAQGVAVTALGLLLLILLFVFLVPRREEIASTFGAARERAAAAEAERDALRTDEPAMRMATQETAPPAVAAAAPAPAPDASTTPPATEAAPAPQTASPSAPDDPRQRELLARPVAIDTGTLLVGRGKVKLAGIEAVPLSHRCGKGQEAWFCGAEARSQFRAWLRARSIRCDVPKDFGGGPDEIVSTCDLAGEDIGSWLVSNGWAGSAAGGPYAEAEDRAKAAKLGIWGERRRAE